MLTDDERRRLRTDLDFDALERLLDRLTLPERKAVLRSLARHYEEPEGAKVEEKVDLRFENAELQELYTAVWRPVREAVRARYRPLLPPEWGSQEVAFKLVLLEAEGAAGRTGVRVVRHPPGQGTDIIALASSRATLRHLAAGLHELMSWRDRSAVRQVESRDVEVSADAPALPRVLTQLLESSLSRARSEAMVDVPQVGRGRQADAEFLPAR